MDSMAQETSRNVLSLPRTSSLVTTKMPAADKDLVFVHLNEVTGPVQDIDTRNKVRAHVMRDFQRKRHHKPKASKSNKRSLLPTAKTDLIEVDTQTGQSLSRVYLGTSSDDDPEASITMMRLPDPQFLGGLELFNTLPIASSPRLQPLIHYYNEVLGNRLIPVNAKNKWFNYAITDPALFHGIMLHTAMHHRLVHGENDEAEQLQFKRNAIKMVEGRLEDPVLSRSDDTIGAVVCLVLLENQEGNVTLSNIHMNGLERMVALRGGIDNLDLAGILRRKILWADLCNATISGREPRFNLTSTSQHLISDFTGTSDISGASLSQSLHMLEEVFSASCACLDEFENIRTSLKAISSQDHLEADITGTLSDSIYLAERNLFYLLRSVSDFPLLHSPLCTAIGAPNFIAAQIYLYHTLRDFPFEVPLFSIFMQRLSATLWNYETGRLSEGWEGQERTLAWVLTLGALGRGVMRGQYVLALKAICAKIGVEDLSDFVKLLESVVWRAGERDLGLVGLWNEVQWGTSFESLGLGKLGLDLDLGIEMTGSMRASL